MKFAVRFSAFALLLFVFATSCTKEEPYAVEENAAAPALNACTAANPAALQGALPVNTNVYCYLATNGYATDNIPEAIITYAQDVNRDKKYGPDDTYMTVTVADFKCDPAACAAYMAGLGIEQGTGNEFTSFGLLLQGAKIASQGFNIRQATVYAAGGLSQYSVASEKLVRLAAATDDNYSYVNPLQTPLSNVAGWEIYDSQNKSAMVMTVIDNRWGYVVSANNQASTANVCRMLNEDVVTAIRKTANSK